MTEDDFYALCWKLATVVACIAILTAGSCTMYESYLIVSKSPTETNPMHFRCALSGNTNSAVCAILSEKSK